MIRLASLLNESNDLDSIAQSEFGMDYDQLGPNEQEWCRDELDNRGLAECGDCERQGTDYTHGHDHEASMADSELRDMISNASKLQNIIQPGDELPGWVSAYISLAADYMHSVAEYMIGKQHEMGAMQQPTPGFAVVAESVDLKKVHAADATIRNLMRNISTNSNISTADKQGLLQALGELQEFIDEVGYDSEIEDDEEEYASDYSKRRAQEKGY